MTTVPRDAHRPPNRPPVYAVDFDDTLAKWDCGKPIAHEVEAILQLAGEGWWILLHTARTSSQWEEPARSVKVHEMLVWLVANDVPFDQVWGLELAWQEESPKPEDASRHWLPLPPGNCWEWLGWRFNGDSGKPVADMYRDDRADGHCACDMDAQLRSTATKRRATERIVQRARLLAGIAIDEESE